MKKIINVDLPQRCRIIAISDIHQSNDLLLKLLDKCRYDPDSDYLFIVGDVLERGDDKLKSLKTVMKLCENERCCCLTGNNDTLFYHITYKYTYEHFLERMKNRPDNAFVQAARMLGITDLSEENFENAKKAVKEKFKAELDFLEGLPTAVNTEDFIFVHAGLDERADWLETDKTDMLCKWRYLDCENLTGKWVIVGHFPTYNFEASKNTPMPIIDKAKKIIDIDGGNQIKEFGQLNALIITKDGNNIDFETRFADNFQSAVVTEDFLSGEKYIFAHPYYYNYSFVDKDDDFTTIHIDTTGETGRLLNELVYKKDDGSPQCWYNLDILASVKRGDVVSVCKEYQKYSLILDKNREVKVIENKYLKYI